VHFHNTKLGWAVGHDAVILRTKDGGLNWQLMFQAPQLDQPLLDIWFADEHHGYAIGAYGYFLETQDGGETWEERRIGEDDWHLNAIAQTDSGLMFIAAEAGNLYHSDDNGLNWKLLPTPYQGSFHGVLPLGGNSLVVFGLRGHMFRSDNAGQSWDEVETGTQALLTDAIRLEDGRLALVGTGGTVLLSAVDAKDFALIQLPDRRGLASLLTNGTTLIAFGEDGFSTVPLSPYKPATGGTRTTR
jgi:photosystem II stability/assembly factor-like uncharacterized protein